MCRQDHQAHPETFKLGKSDVNHDPASQIGKTVVNLSKIKLSKSEISLLEKGLNYIPTPKTLKNEPILDSARQFGRRLKLAYRFRNSKYNSKENFTAKSNWTPPDKEIPQLVLDTIKNIESDISNLKVPLKKMFENCIRDDSFSTNSGVLPYKSAFLEPTNITLRLVPSLTFQFFRY